MSEKNEPAFPNSVGGGQFPHQSTHVGMRLRDYFAAKALQGMLAGNDRDWLDFEYSHIANSSYHLADAMMKARG